MIPYWQETRWAWYGVVMNEKKHSLTLRLDDIEKEKLEKLAEASGLSLAATMRQLIRNAKLKP